MVLLDKPHGITSFSAAHKVARIYGEKKVGHLGTLDPMATGVLPVLLGSATRLADYIPASEKAYSATLWLGICTDTYDITGTTVGTSQVSVNKDSVEEVLSRFRGEIMQTPPMYSAIKINGTPLYKLARAGVDAEIKPRRVNIYSLRLCGNPSENEYTIEVRCSKGTYIRSLVNDIGRALGCGAVLTALRRIESGRFPETQCRTVDEIANNPEKCIVTPAEAVGHLFAVYVSERQAVRFTNGGELDINRLSEDPPKNVPVKVMFNDILLGIAVADEEETLRPKCVLERPCN